MNEEAKAIVDARSYKRCVGGHPQPGEYVITAMQAGNIRGERGWHRYIGYVVQVRKSAGAFGSDIVLLRHPDGALVRHENQAFFQIEDQWLDKAKALYPPGMTPDEYEDYSQPYTLGEDYPEYGKIIEAKEEGPPRDDAPMMRIVVTDADGSQSVTVV